ncbi:MAG TPA: NYN domain-containing protein [Bryobacteraceae bacterium]|nr:NYN domain-containing protein [Bryobacteraceae bacterium]
MRQEAVFVPSTSQSRGEGAPGLLARRFRTQKVLLAAPKGQYKELNMEQKLKIAVFIDFDNIEIGVKSTLHREFDVAAVLDALKERGEIVTKFAYANWGRQESATRALSEHAVQMVQRDPSPRGDKNGADINLALDALEMAFTHDHINAFAIVSGDSDFIALVNKLKQYDKRIFVVGGRAFTSTILQKNCHEFVAYESIIDDPRPRQGHPPASQAPAQDRPPQDRPPQERPPDRQPQQQQQPRQMHKRVALDLTQAMPLVERALGVLERREVRPQLGLLKSTMLQLDSTFNEKAYGAGSFTDFVEKLQKADFVEVTGGEGRYMIRMKGGNVPEKPTAKPEQAIPILRDVLETHRFEVDNGAMADELADWVRQDQPSFNWRDYGFQEFSELLNYAQDKGLVRNQADEERGLIVYLGAEFHPPAPPPEPEPPAIIEEEEDEPQPLVPGQPTATGEIPIPEPPPKPQRRPRAPRKTSGDGSPKKRSSSPRTRKKQPV